MHDQHEAIKWVHDNAERLGGDPSKITLVGHGSGANLASLHLFYRDSWPLYNNMILQSGNPLASSSLEPISLDDANRRAKQVLSYVNCFNESTVSSEEVAQCAQDSDFVARAGIDFLTHSNNNSRVGELFTYTIFPPVIDGFVLTDSPVTLLKSGIYEPPEFDRFEKRM